MEFSSKHDSFAQTESTQPQQKNFLVQLPMKAIMEDIKFPKVKQSR